MRRSEGVEPAWDGCAGARAGLDPAVPASVGTGVVRSDAGGWRMDETERAPSRGAPVPGAYVAFDCETTGLDPRRDGLLQLAAVAQTAHGAREWSTLVDPGRPVDLQIQRLTGITPERLRGAPDPETALREFRAFVGDLPLVAHNAAFDLAFVQTGLRHHRLRPLASPVYDTLTLARLLEPAAEGHRLEDLARRRQIVLDRAHDALADARAAGLLFGALLRDLAAMDVLLLRTLAHILRRAPDPLSRLIVDLAGGAQPAFVHRTLPPIAEEPAREDSPAPLPELAELLQQESPLGRLLCPFEARPGQARMMGAVATAFASDRHLIAEAGTGTGKSLAYLLPALAWASSQGRPVVVSTHTVNLQEQLVGKDLPLIVASGALPGRVALVKGRAQYACLKLWEERLQVDPDPADAPFLARFATWLAQTETGDCGELGLFGEDEERFSTLSADAVACAGRRCPHYDPCFLFRARRRAELADVIVVNHALLFANMGADVLPEFGYLVCDEAHHLEDAASQHLGRVVGERSAERFWRLLERGEAAGELGGRPAGVLAALRARHAPVGLLAAAGGAATDVVRQLDFAAAALRTAREGASAYFDGLRAFVARRQASSTYGRATVRFEPRPEGGADPVWDTLVIAGERMMQGLADLGRGLEAAAASLDDGSPEAAAGTEQVAQLQGLAARAREFAEDVQLALAGRQGWVTWCEVAETRSGGQGAVVLRACPVDPGPILERALFAAKRSVVLTSATLSVRGRFDYLRGRLGLADNEEGRRTDELIVDSPFDYRLQALLTVPSNAPRPVPGDAPAHARMISPWLARLLGLSRGHALVLFTSNRLMREVADLIRPTLEAVGIACLAQGLDGSRSHLAAALRRGEETVVLGSASFWEGVDVQGDALRCLVIAQLPFWPPDIPLQQARQESILARGGSPFRELQLPQAVLRFKQGFGRLIRSASDRGVAVVLDPRIVTADYGRSFLGSLPDPEILIGSGEVVLIRAAEWWRAGMSPSAAH